MIDVSETKVPDWVTRGKTIYQLIKELKTFEKSKFHGRNFR